MMASLLTTTGCCPDAKGYIAAMESVFTLDPYVVQPTRAELKAASPRNVPPTRTGCRGIVGTLGEVTVERVGLRSHDGGAQRTRAEVRGAEVPAVVLTGRAVWGEEPSLDGAELTVDGGSVPWKMNVLGVRKADRALRFAYQGRAYAYTLLPKAKGAQLCRDGVCVLLEPFKAKNGMRGTRGTMSGPTDGVDVALGVVFEQVDTRLLSPKAATALAPYHLLDRFARASRAPGQ